MDNMEVSTQEVVETTSTEQLNQPEVVETTTEATPPPVETAPTYTPDFKVISYDKEFEIPEDFRSFIKDAESEKKAKEIFGKYYSFDTLKERNAKLRESFTETDTKFKSIVDEVKDLYNFIDKQDFDNVLSKLKIDEKSLMEWMYKKLSLNDLPKDQQELYNKNREYQQQLYQLEKEKLAREQQLQEFQTMEQQQKINQVHQTLDNLISAQNVADIAKNFDLRVGQPGAFKQEVIYRADMHEKMTGESWSPEEAVQQTLKIHAFNAQPKAETKQFNKGAVEQKPTLPNIAGPATSPASQKIKTLDDLKNLKNKVIQQARSEAGY